MSEALTEQNLALWQSCGLVLLAMDGKPPNVFHDVRGLDSATMNRLLDAARAEGSANLSKVMEENARLREALEPFAKLYRQIIADHGVEWFADEGQVMRAALAYPVANSAIVWRHFRLAEEARARSLLSREG